MNWIWQGCKRSIPNVHRILLRGTLRRAEILRLLVRVLLSTKAPMFSSSSRIRCTYLNSSTEFCTLKGDPFWPVLLTTSEQVSVGDSPSTLPCRNSSRAAVSSLLQKTHIDCFFPNTTTCSYELSWFPSWLWR